MSHSIEPFALQLFRRHRDGESIEALALGLGIPEERIRQRLRVASLLYERRSTSEGLFALAAELDEAHVF
jgi:hypothetical protein